jgi:hypothetical protein
LKFNQSITGRSISHFGRLINKVEQPCHLLSHPPLLECPYVAEYISTYIYVHYGAEKLDV